MKTPSIQRRGPTPGRRQRKDAGFTLLEVTAAMALLGVSALGALSVTVSSMTLEATNRDSAVALAATQQVVEQMQSVPFDEIFARFNANPADDPDGNGTALGADFSLTTWEDAERKQVAPMKIQSMEQMTSPIEITVEFPMNGNQLDESPDDPIWGGRAWDLDGDGDTSGFSGTYEVLPVRVVATWVTPSGDERQIVIPRLLTKTATGAVSSDYVRTADPGTIKSY